MTVGFVPAFDPKIAASFDGDGASIFHHAPALDIMAEERGLPTLSSFADDREAPPDFDGLPEELVEAVGPWNAWFPAAEGLRCVVGLLDALDADPEMDGVIADLEALEAVLEVAVKKKAKFRLEVA